MVVIFPILITYLLMVLVTIDLLLVVVQQNKACSVTVVQMVVVTVIISLMTYMILVIAVAFRWVIFGILASAEHVVICSIHVVVADIKI